MRIAAVLTDAALSVGCAGSSASVGQVVDPFEVMKNTRGLAPAELVDYTFVFH